MPGLLGIFHKDSEKIDLKLLEAMISSLWHRKIYEKTMTIDERKRYGIADIRLPIIKHEGMPFTSKDGQIKIWMHGEIYNEGADPYNQLEYIYDYYRKFDLKFPLYLNGSFLIFLVDESRNRIVIANDRTASRPLFYFFHRNVLYCAPELKALLVLPSVKKALNLSAIASFLSCGYLLNGETWIEDIKALDNASILVFSDKGAQFIKYWNYLFDEDAKDLGTKHYQDILSELIHKAVKSRIRTNHKYGILLSGGYDSRGILGCVLREKDHGEIKTISWGSREDILDGDCIVARRLAEKVGVQHTFYPLDAEKLSDNIKDFIYLNDGTTDSCANYPESLRLFEKIRNDLSIDILLRGDECFGWSATAFDEKTMFQTLGVRPLHELEEFKNIINIDKMSLLKSKIDTTLEDLLKKVNFKTIHSKKDFFYLDQRLKHYLNPLSYVKRIEIEIRNPFIDNDILDFVVSLPEKYRIRKYLYTKTIREMFPWIFTEMAYKTNLIAWDEQLKESPKLRAFLEEEFLHDSSAIFEIINAQKFTNFRQDRRAGAPGLMRRNQEMLIRRYPEVYRVAKYIQVWLRKRSGRVKMTISKGAIVRRVLTLKIWCDLFLEGKAKAASDSL
ncbi:MAG: asparagine synthase-related protein [Candidatus Entotheonellia bacterium]